MSRYNKRSKAINENELYEDILERRDLKQVRQFRTPILLFPMKSEDKQLSYYRYNWSPGDKYYALAAKYYGDPTLWWVIAQYNKKPTEQHVKAGESIKIPYPLGLVLQLIG